MPGARCWMIAYLQLITYSVQRRASFRLKTCPTIKQYGGLALLGSPAACYPATRGIVPYGVAAGAFGGTPITLTPAPRAWSMAKTTSLY